MRDLRDRKDLVILSDLLVLWDQVAQTETFQH